MKLTSTIGPQAEVEYAVVDAVDPGEVVDRLVRRPRGRRRGRRGGWRGRAPRARRARRGPCAAPRRTRRRSADRRGRRRGRVGTAAPPRSSAATAGGADRRPSLRPRRSSRCAARHRFGVGRGRDRLRRRLPVVVDRGDSGDRVPRLLARAPRWCRSAADGAPGAPTARRSRAARTRRRERWPGGRDSRRRPSTGSQSRVTCPHPERVVETGRRGEAGPAAGGRRGLVPAPCGGAGEPVLSCLCCSRLGARWLGRHRRSPADATGAELLHRHQLRERVFERDGQVVAAAARRGARWRRRR